MTLSGGCMCGAVRYELRGDAVYTALCHCADCRRHSGAPVSGWTCYKADDATITGAVSEYASSDDGRRYFCPTCGTAVHYINEAVLPGLVDFRTGTLDDPEQAPPAIHVQTAERLHWMEGVDALPGFERYPGP